MSIAPYIRVVGRGRDGARALNREQAEDLMARVLDGRVSDLELGAFVLAMRIKGESVDELTGFLAAVRARCLELSLAAPTVILPSYNGSRRLPNLTPLLALLLARRGVPVLVHGTESDPSRVTTAAILRELGLVPASGAGTIEAAWCRGEPAFIGVATLCPPLARLLAVRDVVGVRNSGHTVAKLLAVGQGAATLRVMNFTHPDYAVLLGRFLAATAGDALLMRGTEGEPVADSRRRQRLDVYLGGELQAELSMPAQDGVVAPTAASATCPDAAATAATIQAMLGGALPIPEPIAAQVDCLVRAAAALTHRASSTPVTAAPAQ